MSEFLNEGDSFYAGEDEAQALRAISRSEPRPGFVVGFAPKSFFAERGGVLRAVVTSTEEPDDGDRGSIVVRCLDGTDCYLSPGETETFPMIGWQNILEVLEVTTSNDNGDSA